MTKYYCPDCGGEARLIEKTEPDSMGEYKDVLTCDSCENIVYVVRHRGEGHYRGGHNIRCPIG